MERKRRPRRRATRVRVGDSRAAGFYEQTIGDRSSVGLRRILAAVAGSLAGLQISGRIDGPQRLSFTDLRMLAESSWSQTDPGGAHQIDLIDLLSHVRVHADADVVVLDTLEHGDLALPFEAICYDTDLRLELGGSRADGTHDWHAPITLHGRRLPGPVSIIGIAARAFSDVVGVAP